MSETAHKKRYGVYFLLLAGLLGVIGLSAKYMNDRAVIVPTPAAVAVAQEPTEPEEELPAPKLVHYIEIIRGCSPQLGADCATVHAEPAADSRVVAQLRKGTVLKVREMTYKEEGIWFRVEFDEWLRYPDRVAGNWYVSGEYVRLFKHEGPQELQDADEVPENKFILVDRSEQKLYAYENDELFMEQSISTGLLRTPTPRGTFSIYKKTPTRYMQGPLPGISDKYYDLPGVPWNLYFTHQGAVVHGAYWHDQFGTEWSSGCVNVPTDKAEKLYSWADLGTPVIVHD